MIITAGTIIELITTNNGTGRGVDVLLTSDWDTNCRGYGGHALLGDVVLTYGGRGPIRVTGDRITSTRPVGRYQEVAA